MRAPWKTGCVLFDDPAMRTGGWVAVADEDGTVSEPYRIDGTGRLSSDVVWWTNLDWTQMSTAGLLSNARFRPESFLRIRMAAIFAEWGAGDADPDRKVVLGATLFWRIMMFVFLHYGFERIPIDFLKSGLRDVWRRDPVLSPVLREALKDSLTEFTSCERTDASVANSSRNCSFTIPRASLARGIMATPVPLGEWKVVPEDKIPRNYAVDESIRKWLIEGGVPVLIQATVTDINPERNAIFGFGSGVRRRASPGGASYRFHSESNRSWMTLDEAIVLSSYAKVIVKKAIAADPEKMEKLENLAPGWPVKEEGPLEDLSWSYGLFLENIWVARAFPFPREAETSVWQVFYRSYDHVLCMQSAWMLHQHGIIVTGYGAGRIFAKIPNGMTDAEIAAIALAAGCVPDYLGTSVPLVVPEDSTTAKARLGFLIRGSSEPERVRYHESDRRCLKKHWDTYGEIALARLDKGAI